jgi:hypothetical protein
VADGDRSILKEREQAKNAGLKKFFSDSTCKHGHRSERETSTGCCLECKRKYRKSDSYKTKRHFQHKRRKRRDNALGGQARIAARVRRLLIRAVERASKKGLLYNLSLSWALNRWTGHCEVTGIAFAPWTDSRSLFSPSIDRIDNNIPNCHMNLIEVS